MDATAIMKEVDVVRRKVCRSLDTEEWKKIIPGRPVINTLANRAKMNNNQLKELYIDVAEAHELNPFKEIREIFEGWRDSSG